MKKLLLLSILVSSLSFGQETSYYINNFSNYAGFPDFFTTDSHLYLVSPSSENGLPCVSKVPLTGDFGTTKFFDSGFPYSGFISSIVKCNLSDNFIVAFQLSDNSQCQILKIDPDLNIIWAKTLEYPVLEIGGNYGSNSTPLTINEQDEITICLTPYSMIVLAELNTNGDLIASKKIESSDNIDSKNPGFSIIRTSDQGYLITMKNGSNPTITKMNMDFQIEWSKRWSIDGYSHPKTCAQLPNNHFYVVGDGDLGTYIAETDENGILLNYRAGLSLVYPYNVTMISDDSLKVLDSYGRSYTVNINSWIGVLKTTSKPAYGIPKFINGKSNLLSPGGELVYVDLEREENECFNIYEQTLSLYEREFDLNDISNENIIVSNFGEIGNYTPTITSTNSVYLTEYCTLSLNETESKIIRLYPNPGSSGQNTTIEFEKSQGSKVQILSLSGKMMDSYSLNGTSEQITFNTPHESGMYLVQVLDISGNVIAVEKLVVE